MDERLADDPVALQLEIAEKRRDLELSLDRLRGNLRRKIEVGRKVRDGVLLAALLGGAVISLVVMGVRARRRSRSPFSWG
jgi:hypothetical protein